MKKKKLELELAATQKQLGGIPGIGTGVGMEIAANPVGNHVYNPQSVSVPPARLEKTVSKGKMKKGFLLVLWKI